MQLGQAVQPGPAVPPGLEILPGLAVLPGLAGLAVLPVRPGLAALPGLGVLSGLPVLLVLPVLPRSPRPRCGAQRSGPGAALPPRGGAGGAGLSVRTPLPLAAARRARR